MGTERAATARAIVASYVGVLVFASVPFVAAGRLAYPAGVLYAALALIGATVSHLLVPAGSTITADRLRDAPAGEAWDRRLLAGYFLVNVGTFVVAGLDERFAWTRPLPAAVTALGVVGTLAGQALFAVAKRVNAAFSGTVRIQAGHAVCDRGPYRLVRHPGYLGMLLSQLAVPLVLDAPWAFAPAVVAAGVLVARTVREDAFLMAELPGYAAFAARTRWRLVPYVL